MVLASDRSHKGELTMRPSGYFVGLEGGGGRLVNWNHLLLRSQSFIAADLARFAMLRCSQRGKERGGGEKGEGEMKPEFHWVVGSTTRWEG